MPRPPARPSGEKSTRERILDVALELFNTAGYEGTSLREIAERMHFSKAALYYHFASKDDILLALHMRLHALGKEGFEDLDADRVRPEQWPELLDRAIVKMLDNRPLFMLHVRNHAAFERLHETKHSTDHADLKERIYEILGDQRVAVALRVRLACAIGALMTGAMLAGDVFADVPTTEMGKLLREAIGELIGSPDASRFVDTVTAEREPNPTGRPAAGTGSAKLRSRA